MYFYFPGSKLVQVQFVYFFFTFPQYPPFFVIYTYILTACLYEEEKQILIIQAVVFMNSQARRLPRIFFKRKQIEDMFYQWLYYSYGMLRHRSVYEACQGIQPGLGACHGTPIYCLGEFVTNIHVIPFDSHQLLLKCLLMFQSFFKSHINQAGHVP